MLNIITQHRRGTTEEWESSKVAPRDGELIIEECTDGISRFKFGNGRDLFKDLPYSNKKEIESIELAHSRISNLVEHEDLDANSLSSEVTDIRLSHDNIEYPCAGDAVRAIGADVQDLRESLTQFINADAVDGLYYANSMLYLTADGKIIEESGVQIISGSGGGGGGSASALQIQYITKSPVVITVDDDALLEFMFSGTDSSGDNIEQASGAWKVDGRTVEYTTVKSGLNQFDVTKYLKIGTSKVLLTVTDDAGNIVTKTWSIQKVDVRIESAFNDQVTYTANEPIVFEYKPYGAVDKKIHFVLDGEEVAVLSCPAKISGTVQKYELPAQAHGSHLLDIYITSTINEVNIESNHVLKDIVWYSASVGTPVIGTVTQEFTAKQYDTTNIDYVVFDPTTETPEVSISVDNKLVSNLVLQEATATYSYKTTDIGEHEIKIVCRDTEKIIKATVEKIDIDISPVTVGLAFDFNPVGKSNDDVNRLWTDGNVSMSVSDNFDWINGGYRYDDNSDPCFVVKSGTRAYIDYKLFADDAKKHGKEFKLIFKTTNVSNPEATFLSCLDELTGGAKIGLDMSVHTAYVHGQNGALELSYSEEDIVEFEFNISKLDEEVPMVMGYEDGVSTRPLVYDSSYSFTHNDAKVITIGCDDCDVYIYRFKVYDTSLTNIEILNNFIADARTTEEVISRYNRNQIYDENQNLTPDTLAAKCPWLRVYKLSAPQFTNNKSNKIKNTTIQQIYKNGDPVLDNWTCYNAQHSGQGTSSNNYGASGRNLDFIMNKDGAYFELGDGTTASKITLTRESVPTAYLNAKVNIASSNNLTNAILANRYNRFNPYRRPFVRPEGTNLEFIKDTMEFHNCVIFIQETDPDLTTHREFADTDWHFYAIGNIGDSKKTDSSRATDPDDKHECCVEIMDVGRHLSDFPADTMINAMEYTEDETTFERTYKWATNENLGILYEKQDDGSYELTSDTAVDYTKTYYVDILEQDDFSEDYTYGWRYLGDEDDADAVEYCKQKWIELYRFITSSSDEEFKAHLGDYFVLDSALYYYLFTTRYCMVDNRAKNTFWHYGKTADGSYKWDLCWDYDNDTSMGLNNYGKQVYRYGLEDIDKDASGEEVFRESDSTFFCRVRDLFRNELRAMYQTIDAEADWSAEALIKECDEWQAEFPEELWRVDIERKYIRTYTTSFINGPGDSQFLVNMCNGRMKYHRRQWERSQEQYISSKYQTGRISGDINHANFRFGASNSENPVIPANYSLTLTPYYYTYLNVYYGGTAPSSIRAVPNVPVTVPYNGGTQADIVNVWNAKSISDFGDLSACYPKTVSVGNAKRITRLKIGNDTEGYSNTVFTTLTTGANELLEELDIENIQSLENSLNISELINLVTLKAYGTKIRSVTFAEGGKLSTIELPAVNSLIFKNLLYLANSGINLESYDNVLDLCVEGCPNIDALTLLNRCKNVYRLRITDLDLNNVDFEEFSNKFFRMKGLNAAGEETPNAWLTGRVQFNTLTGSQYKELATRYPHLKIEFKVITCSVKFFDTDLVTELYSQEIRGSNNLLPSLLDPVETEQISAPIKESTIDYNFTWFGWSDKTDYIPLENSILDNIGADLILYPTFTKTVRQYVIRFLNNDGATIGSYPVDYGAVDYVPPIDTSILVKGNVSIGSAYKFEKWVPNSTDMITGERTCYATYSIREEAIHILTMDDIQCSISDAGLTITKYLNEVDKIIRIPEYITSGDVSIAITGISDDVFKDKEMEYVELPETLQVIGANAFSGNDKLTSITIPESVTELHKGAFAYCRGLMEIYYNAIDADVIRPKSDDPYIFGYTNTTAGYTVYIGNKVTNIPASLFNVGSLSEGTKGCVEVVFEEGSVCTEINATAFYYSFCKKINLPDSLQIIYENAFFGCEFEEIVLPKNIVQVDNYAFGTNDNLKYVWIPASLTKLSSMAFNKCDNVEFEIEEGSKYIWVNNCFLDVSKANSVLMFGQSDAVIPDNLRITTIDIRAFEETEIENVVLPSTLTKLEDYSFYKCYSLSEVEFNDALTVIDQFAFDSCPIEVINLPNNLQQLGAYSFARNSAVTEVVIPSSLTSLSIELFKDCKALEKVNINCPNARFNAYGSGVIKYFSGCENLTNITVAWNSDGSLNGVENTKLANLNSYAPWGAGTSDSDGKVPAKDVSIHYMDKTIVHKIDGTKEEKGE